MWSEFAKRTALKVKKSKKKTKESKSKKGRNEKLKDGTGKKKKSKKKKKCIAEAPRLRLEEFKRTALAEFEKMVKLHFERWEELQRSSDIPALEKLPRIDEMKPSKPSNQAATIKKLSSGLKSRALTEMKNLQASTQKAISKISMELAQEMKA